MQQHAMQHKHTDSIKSCLMQLHVCLCILSVGFGCVLCPLLSRWPQCTLGYIVYSAHPAEKVFQVQPKAALGNMLRQPCMANPLPVHHHQWANFSLENFKSKVFARKIGLEGSIIIKWITWMSDSNAMHALA